jgi:hypothetical protein
MLKRKGFDRWRFSRRIPSLYVNPITCTRIIASHAHGEARPPASLSQHPSAGTLAKHRCRADKTLHVAAARGPMPGHADEAQGCRPAHCCPPPCYYAQAASGIHQAPVCRQGTKCHGGEHYADAGGDCICVCKLCLTFAVAEETQILQPIM